MPAVRGASHALRPDTASVSASRRGGHELGQPALDVALLLSRQSSAKVYAQGAAAGARQEDARNKTAAGVLRGGDPRMSEARRGREATGGATRARDGVCRHGHPRAGAGVR
ncbi:hypothetical protein GSI_04571 [Ganoderma sinense ZZ0214-1]|uniref:Uncharacterized protein n=1 Tax=Ganoderma sinense ZZ0214-1 TaxID=1077348 RepID=A0A2G8SH84_9APHY|nr:hypothetical protein GSI_04571 [Ganoderma sinense ZZ0214-1]